MCDLYTNQCVIISTCEVLVKKVFSAYSYVHVYIIQSEHLLSATLPPTFHNSVVP